MPRIRRLLLSLAGVSVALAGGVGLAIAIAAVTSTTVTGNNLVCKVSTATVPCSSSTSLSNGQSLTVGANANKPVAAFTITPNPVIAGQATTFDAASSTCALPCSYRWTDPSDGSTYSTASSFSYTFHSLTPHQVTLAITDGTGQTASLTQSFTVQTATTTTTTTTTTTSSTTTTTPPPPPTGFPDATNTGYQNAPDYPGSLHSCSQTIQSNTTYNFCDYPGGVNVGASGAPVSNVTFHGCRFHGVGSSAGLVLLYGDNITIDYSTISPDAASPPVSYSQGYQYGVEGDGSYRTFVQQLTMTHDNVWGFGNAVDIAGSTQAKPQVFRDNYIHDARQDGGIDHTDGIGDLSGSGSGSYDVIDHNTIMSAGNTNGIAFQQGSYSNFQITNNLFGGFGNTIALWAPAPNTTFTGNTFSTLLKPVWTPLYPQNFWTSPGSVWKNNKWSVPAGAAWGNPAHDGWYWIPNSADISGTDDTPYVSQTGP